MRGWGPQKMADALPCQVRLASPSCVMELRPMVTNQRSEEKATMAMVCCSEARVHAAEEDLEALGESCAHLDELTLHVHHGL